MHTQALVESDQECNSYDDSGEESDDGGVSEGSNECGGSDGGGVCEGSGGVGGRCLKQATIRKWVNSIEKVSCC